MDKILAFIFGLIAVSQAASTQCPRMCTMEYSPVCGSDGKTYGNDCALRAKACASGQLRMMYRGECQSGRPETREEECPRMCPFNYAPVCGTDGRTYNNECQLNAKRCRSRGQQLSVASQGACQEQAAERERPAPADRRQRCMRACTREYDPQCGSDGRTYPNKCTLRVASCMARGTRDSFRRARAGTC